MKYQGVMNHNGTTLPAYIESFRWNSKRQRWIGSYGTTAESIVQLRIKGFSMRRVKQ